jgi:hypothetical protein
LKKSSFHLLCTFFNYINSVFKFINLIDCGNDYIIKFKKYTFKHTLKSHKHIEIKKIAYKKIKSYINWTRNVEEDALVTLMF